MTIDGMVTRYVTTPELAAFQCRESFARVREMFTEEYAEVPRLCGVDLNTERAIVLLPGESCDTAAIHIAEIAKALKIEHHILAVMDRMDAADEQSARR